MFHFGYRNKYLGEKDDPYNLLAHQHKHTLLFPFIDHFLITTLCNILVTSFLPSFLRTGRGDKLYGGEVYILYHSTGTRNMLRLLSKTTAPLAKTVTFSHTVYSHLFVSTSVFPEPTKLKFEM